MATSINPFWEIDYDSTHKSWSLTQILAGGHLRIFEKAFGTYADAESAAKARHPQFEIKMTKAAKQARRNECKT